MAVYRGLDIGTDKPVGAEPPWHLIDLAEPSEEFSVARFQREAVAAIDAIHSRRSRAILVGGTGLYHRAVLDRLELPGRFPDVAGELAAEASSGLDGLGGLYERLRRLDPLAASRIEPGNERRVLRALEVTLGSGRQFSSYGEGLESYGEPGVAMAGLRLDRSELDARLAARLEDQLERGFADEVASLASRPGGLSRTARQAIGYAELIALCEGEISLEEATALILRRLKSFARRQESWFRRDPRVCWFEATDPHLAELVATWWTAEADRARPSAWETEPQ
jgi:tRNA dimethylallyltransferase